MTPTWSTCRSRIEPARLRWRSMHKCPGQLCAKCRSEQIGRPAQHGKTKTDAETHKQTWHDQAGDGEVEDHTRAWKTPAKAQCGCDREYYRQQADDRSKLDRASERSGDVRHHARLEYVMEPLERCADHGERHATVRSLERQQVDHEHRAVEE